MKKMIALVLMGVGLITILFSALLLGFSASLVNEIEKETGADISINGGDAKSLVSFFQMMHEADGRDVSVYDVIDDDMDIDDKDFHTFALYSRGWFFWIGIVLVLAGVALLAVDQDASITEKCWALVKTFGLAAAAGFAALFASVVSAMPKKTAKRKSGKAVTHTCPNCGAEYTDGSLFCATCGNRLPEVTREGICPTCNAKNAPNARFCAACGNPMTAAAPAAAPEETAVPEENNDIQL